MDSSVNPSSITNMIIFDKLKTGDSFIEIIQGFEVDLINQKITEYKNSFAS